MDGHGQKWVWPVWSQDSKIGSIVRMNWWNELIFCILVQIQEAKSYFDWFLGGLGQNGCGHLVHETLKYAEWVYGLSWFLADWLWCSNFFVRPTPHFLFLMFECQSTAVVLVSSLVAAGKILWGSFHPSLLASVWVLSWNLIIRFLWILPGC